VVTFILNHCLAPTEGYAYRHTDWWEGFMKYAVEIGLVAILFIPSFTNIGSAIKNLMGGIHRHTDIMVIT
jgi:hypothetical protein